MTTEPIVFKIKELIDVFYCHLLTAEKAQSWIVVSAKDGMKKEADPKPKVDHKRYQ